MNGGMLVIGGDEYRSHRKAIMPIFVKDCLRRYLVITNTKMRNFLQRFEMELDSKPFDFIHQSCDFALDTLLATLFGMSVEKDVRAQFLHDADR